MSVFGRDRYGNSLTQLDVLGPLDTPDPKCPMCHGSGIIGSAGCTSAIYHKCYCVNLPATPKPKE